MAHAKVYVPSGIAACCTSYRCPQQRFLLASEASRTQELAAPGPHHAVPLHRGLDAASAVMHTPGYGGGGSTDPAEFAESR